MRGDTWMRIGAVITGVGIVCGLISMLPLITTRMHPVSLLWPLSMLTGVGLAMILMGLRRSAKVRKSLK